MKKAKVWNIIILIFTIGLFLLYLINPLHKKFEFNGAVSFVLFFLILIRLINKNKIIDIIIISVGICFFLGLVVYYFL